MSCPRVQVLKSLQLSLMEDCPGAQISWDAIQCGQDASVQAAKAIWGETIVLPAFCRLKAAQHQKLLVVANETLCTVLKAEIARWAQVLPSSDGRSDTQNFSLGSSTCVLLTPEEINVEKLQLAGLAASSVLGLVILVILHAKEESTSLLRSALQVLPLPNQVILGVEQWDESTRQLAAEILGSTAVEVSLDARPFGAKLDEKDQNKNEKEEDDAHLVATFMANIISRSDDQDFRAACRALLKVGAAKEADTLPEGASIAEMEDAEFRQNLGALMAEHQRLTRAKPGKASKGKKRGNREIETAESAKRLAADWDCSESWD